MAQFKPNEAVETDDPKVEVTIGAGSELKPGSHRFQLVVVDDSGNESVPSVVQVIVIDDGRPTAVLTAPRAVPFGQSFALLGDKSVDSGGGKIVRYLWTLVDQA